MINRLSQETICPKLWIPDLVKDVVFTGTIRNHKAMMHNRVSGYDPKAAFDTINAPHRILFILPFGRDETPSLKVDITATNKSMTSIVILQKTEYLARRVNI